MNTKALLAPKTLAPLLAAVVPAAIYVATAPPSGDLAAHLLRAKLFSVEGFGLWNNWWYAGHHVVLYSVLFPAVAAALTPQLGAAAAAVATAIVFERMARERWGAPAWLGSTWFSAGTASSLYAGRLTFAFGLAPAVAAAYALQRRRPAIATSLAFLTALCSPVAALFAALAGGAQAAGALASTRRVRAAIPGIAVVAAALLPVGALAVAFPEGGTEPFAFSAMWPLPVIGAGAVLLMQRADRTLLAGVVLYVGGVVVSFAVPTAIGSNSARLGELLAGPLAALLLWPDRRRLLLALAPVLVYVQWHAPIRDLSAQIGDPSSSSAYYQPLLSFLGRQPGPPFRVEIPFTRFHWESYAVAPRFPLARGWERQLDVKYDQLFYGAPLTPETYRAWLDSLAVRFVAVPDSPLDYSATREVALIDRGLPYLEQVDRTRHWRVYEVLGAAPVATGAATLRAWGPDWLALEASRPGASLVRVHYTPYWAITKGSGCVVPAGQFTRLVLRRAGPIRVGIRFALGRIGARSPRCS